MASGKHRVGQPPKVKQCRFPKRVLNDAEEQSSGAIDQVDSLRLSAEHLLVFPPIDLELGDFLPESVKERTQVGAQSAQMVLPNLVRISSITHGCLSVLCALAFGISGALRRRLHALVRRLARTRHRTWNLEPVVCEIACYALSRSPGSTATTLPSGLTLKTTAPCAGSALTMPQSASRPLCGPASARTALGRPASYTRPTGPT